MKRLLSAKLAEFLVLKLALHRFLILVGVVVAIFTFTALQTSQLLFYLAFCHKGQCYPLTQFVAVPRIRSHGLFNVERNEPEELSGFFNLNAVNRFLVFFS